MPDYFAMFLDVRDRPCLVVGGGPIGERKVRDLLASGARVTLVGPAVTPGLGALAEARRITHRSRSFLRSDVRGALLVIAATGVPAVDDAVAAEARRRGALVNVVDRPSRCDFIFPSVLRRGQLQVAVSTGGRSPALAREIRSRLEGLFPEDYGDLVERVGRERRRARAHATTARGRMAAGERVVDLAPFRLPHP